MTPKEKAEELYEKFKPLTLRVTYTINDVSIIESNFNAKQCALIAVNELLDTLYHYEVSNGYTDDWEEVKKEIEKL